MSSIVNFRFYSSGSTFLCFTSMYTISTRVLSPFLIFCDLEIINYILTRQVINSFVFLRDASHSFIN